MPKESWKKIGQEGDTNGKEYYRIERQPTIQEENTLKKKEYRGEK